MYKIMKKILLVFLFTILLSSCWNEQETKKVIKNFSTYTVETWSIDINQNFIWYTQGIKEVNLATKSPWRITYLKKNIWDNVYKWELLVSLDWAEAKSSYSTANNIIQSLYNLKKETWLAYDWQISALKSKVEQVKIWIEWVNIGLQDTKNITSAQLETAKSGVEQAKLGLETAINNLEETKKTLSSKNDNILNWAKTAITQSVILYTNIMDFSDKLLWITQKNKKLNDSFEDYLWTKDSIQLKETEKLFKETLENFLAYEKYYLEKIENKNPNKQELIEWLKIAEKTAELQKKFLNNLYTTVDNSIENIYFTIEAINEYKKNISTFGAQVESSLLSVVWDYTLWIKGSLQNLKDFETNKSKAIILLEKQVELAKTWLKTAQKTYEQYKQISKWKINEVSTKQKSTKASLEEILEWIKALKAKKQASLSEIDAKIAEANGWKKSAWVMINNWKIYSNISWIITQKFASEWQVIDAWMPIFKVVDNSKIKIVTSIPKEIQEKIKIWDKLELKINWLENKIEWKISNISKSADLFTKKYKIEILVDNKNRKISIWEMVKIFIKNKDKNNEETHKKNWIVIIPNSAIISKFMLPAVFVVKDNTAKLKTIKIIKMWEEFSEISWINPLDKIITSWKENIFDGEDLQK